MTATQRHRYGTLEQLETGEWQLRFTRVLAHPVEKVWRAITEPEHLARWFPTTIDGERTAGAALSFSFPQGQMPPMKGQMIAFEPQSKIEFRWGPDKIRLELRAVAEGTKLTLLDTFEQQGKAARDGAGWHACLEALEAALSRRQDAREHMDIWNEVHPRYVEQFGPEAATIGPPEGIG